MNMTAITITFIICMTIIILSLNGGKDKGNKDE